jgi:hypothetical protein
MATVEIKPRELAHRISNGIEVSLFWTKVGNTLTVEVFDTTNDEFFSIDVPGDRALDAFHHPYAYLTASQAGRELDELLAA